MPNILKQPAPSIIQSQRPPQPIPEPDDDWRDIADPVRTRQSIYGKVLKAAQTLQPMQNQRHTLQLSDVKYVDPDYYDLRQQKQAILGNKTLGRRLQGTWNLTDNATGKTLDKQTSTIARVPFMTDRGTFIHNGLEYTVSNQLRMRPGVFTRVKENGEIEAHANIMPGEGVGHRYFLDPAKGVFYIRIQQAKIPLMPLMRALGASDKQLQEAWGNSLFALNAQQEDHGAINKLYDRLVGSKGKATDILEKKAGIAEAMRKMRIEKEVARRTLGKDYENLDLPAVLDTTKKLLAVSRGEQEVDDRDHLAFQTVFTPEDLFSERFARDYGSLRRNLFYKASFKGNLKPIKPGALTRQLEAVLLSSGLGQPIEEVNPAEILDKLTRITKMGEGGLGSLDAVPDESRMTQPSHFGMIDPIRTPESARLGIDLYLSHVLRKGSDGRIYAPFIDLKTKKQVYRSPQDLADLTVAFPGEMTRQGKRVGAMRGGRLGFFPKSEIDLEMPHFENAFSPLAGFIPMKSGVNQQRMAMGSRMSTQAVSLSRPESPFVQTGVPDSDAESFEDRYGSRMGAIRSDKAGIVLKTDADSMLVQYADGTKKDIPLYNHFVLNRKSYIHHTPLVKPGMAFKPGQLLAKTNFTDDNGTAALGLNVRSGYFAMKGMNFEDALVISEGLKKRLDSEHMYQHTLDLDDRLKTKKNDFMSLFPSKFDRKTLDKMDSDGVIKPGTEVQYGDPLILTARQRTDAFSKVHKKGKPMFSDQSQVWGHSGPGVVTDVFKSEKGINVVVKSTSSTQVGDKLSGRYGDKGVIADIIPDDKMPRDEEGNPIEIAFNPLGITTRGNPSQIVEAVLGKIAAKTGKPYKIRDFQNIEDLVEFAEKEARKHGIKDLETITDPETGRGVKDVLVGNRFIMKLSHMAEDKLQGRSFGNYTQDEVPAKGGEEGSKQVGLLQANALISHGATNVMSDAGTIRGQRNEDYWLAFMQGLNPPKPRIPFVYQKFVNQLRAAGINVVESGTKTHIMAMTDKDVGELAGDRLIENGDTVDFAKGLKPLKGGLFDQTLTGGVGGTRWSAIKLHEPIPNPVMEEPMRRLLGLTKNQFEEVLAGKRDLANGMTGVKGIKSALDGIDLNKSIHQARLDIASGKKTRRDDAVVRLGYLKAAQKLKINPSDWIMSKVPVLPPKFRPVSVMSGNELPLVADANFLYKELLEANDNLKGMSGQVDDLADERLAVYHAFKAVTGLGDPVHPKLQEKKVKGVLAHIFGHSPKAGTVQRRLIGSAVDLVGRAVITPNPDYDMDSVGIPEERAWSVYKPFVIRRLRRRGMKMVDALRHVADKSPLARDELVGEMDERPVIIDRAPVWHRFGVMAFHPRLVKGDTMQISPLVVKGFGADFDGDAMQYHVPASSEAVKEALERMLPSKNLLSPADYKTPVHKPSQEYTGGLYAASVKRSKRAVRTFRSLQDAVDAFEAGNLNVDDPIKILQ